MRGVTVPTGPGGPGLGAGKESGMLVQAAGPPLLAGRDTEYLANYDDTEHSAGDSADCAEEDSNVLSQVFSPSTSFCLCFSCLAAICSAFFTYKIRPPMGRPTAAMRLSYHC